MPPNTPKPSHTLSAQNTALSAYQIAVGTPHARAIAEANILVVPKIPLESMSQAHPQPKPQQLSLQVPLVELLVLCTPG